MELWSEWCTQQTRTSYKGIPSRESTVQGVGYTVFLLVSSFLAFYWGVCTIIKWSLASLFAFTRYPGCCYEPENSTLPHTLFTTENYLLLYGLYQVFSRCSCSMQNALPHPLPFVHTKIWTFNWTLGNVLWAKHQYFKDVSRKIHSFKNLAHSLALRHRYFQCFSFIAGERKDIPSNAGSHRVVHEHLPEIFKEYIVEHNLNTTSTFSVNSVSLNAGCIK